MPQTMIATTHQSTAADLLHKAGVLLTAIALRIIGLQRMRREREQLAELSDATLKDLGLSRADVWNELSKPAWRR